MDLFLIPSDGHQHPPLNWVLHYAWWLFQISSEPHRVGARYIRHKDKEEEEPRKGGGREWRSSFMFDTVHKLFRLLGVAAMGRQQIEGRAALLIIPCPKYSPSVAGRHSWPGTADKRGKFVLEGALADRLAAINFSIGRRSAKREQKRMKYSLCRYRTAGG